MTDSEAHVRQASVFAIPSVLKRLSPQRRREVAARYMLQLCEDSADTVRTGALQVLAEVIHTFHQDDAGPPEELLDFFLKGEHDQVQATPFNPEPEPENNASTGNGWDHEPRTWGEPNSYFASEPSFPDPDRALICAFNLPAVALTLGPAKWPRLVGYYSYLAQESWHTPKVRSSLAASTGEIARIIGPKAARADIVPVWWMCMTGDQRETKIKALNALPVLLEALDVEGRTYVMSKLDEAWEKHVPGWKEREAFARQLALVAPMLKSEGLVLCRIFKSGLEDRVAAIREAVIAVVSELRKFKFFI
jgi:serine/threonine-protein phosphatase 4 regulatory subunit 1